MEATCAAREEADAVNVYHSRALRARAEAIKMEIPSWTDPCAPPAEEYISPIPRPKGSQIGKISLEIGFWTKPICH